MLKMKRAQCCTSWYWRLHDVFSEFLKCYNSKKWISESDARRKFPQNVKGILNYFNLISD